MPVGDNSADDFWRGNLVELVENGTVSRVKLEIGPRSIAAPNLRRPASDRPAGLRQGRPDGISMCSALSHDRVQAYDLAPAPNVTEINVGGDFDLPQ